MSLVGVPLLVLLAICTVALPALLIVTWHRLRGPAAVRVAQRVALLTATQISAVLLVAVALNDAGGDLYGSWRGLFDAGSHDVRIVSITGDEPGRSSDVQPGSDQQDGPIVHRYAT